MQYRKEVDGLRALAILPVLFFHAGFTAFSGGYVGVDVFFVISGYLITSLILAEAEAGKFTISSFYERRARRILPALTVVMAATLIPAWIFMTPENLENFGQSLAAVSIFGNNILLALTSGYFAPAADEKPLLHTWSLAVEEQYYVIFPLFITLCWSLGRRWIIALLALAAVASLYAAELGWRTDPQINFYLPQGRAWELLLGALTAFSLRHTTAGQRQTGIAADNTLAIVGVLMVLFAIFFYSVQTPFPSVYALAPAVGTALILRSGHDQTFVGRAFSHPLFVTTGLLSYSLYLWHQPLLAFARLTSSSTPSKMLMFSMILLASGLAYLSWRYVEKPFRNRAFLSRNAIFGLTALCTAVFVALGLAAHLTHGFPNRMSSTYLAELAQFKQISAEREKWLKPACYMNERSLAMLPADLREELGCKVQKTPARILVVGDSHANDKAMSMRMNGIAVDQMVESDCSLAPARMAHRCHQKMNAVVKLGILKNYDFVLLANRWGDVREVQLFEDDLSYWTGTGANLILFGPMPEYGKLPDRMSYLMGQGMSRVDAAKTIRLDESLLRETGLALTAVAQRHGIRFVDTAKLFCSMATRPCSPLSDSQSYFVVDYAHLSEAGARQLGANITQELGLQSFARVARK